MAMRPLRQTKQLLAGRFQRLQSWHESRHVKVSVWWDFENCQVPVGVNVLNVAPAIMEAVRTSGIKGPIRINAFGDVLQLSKHNHEALSDTGIHFTHTPGGKNSADRFLLTNLMDWVSQNPPPAHLFLISGDGDFAGMLHQLRRHNYNILLARSRHAPDVLCSAATIIWQWPSLVKGEHQHLSHPPDRFFGSWCGNYKVIPEKPFPDVENSASSQKVDIYKPSLDRHTVRKKVVIQIFHILRLHPKGILIGDLRSELKKCEVDFGKRFYGYGKFSRFLTETRHVELEPLGYGNFRVSLNPSEFSKPFKRKAVESVASCSKTGKKVSAATPKLNGEDKNKASEAKWTPLTALSHERGMDDDSKSSLSLIERHVSGPPDVLQKFSVCSGKVVDMTTEQLSGIQPQHKDHQRSKIKSDSLKLSSSSKTLSDCDILGSQDASDNIQEKCTSSRNYSAGNDQAAKEDIGTATYESGNFRAMNKYKNSTREEVDEVCHSPNSTPVDDPLLDKIPSGSCKTYRNCLTFFVWIRSWWQFWKGNAKYGVSADYHDKVVSHFEGSKPSVERTVQIVSDFKEPKLSELDQPELFSNVSFWDDIETFIFTLKGSFIVSQSKNREDMAYKLLKDGPPVFRSLTEEDILKLVELLISEKKWLEETPSQIFPFRVTQPVRNSLMGQSQGANGLRSLFLSRASQSKLQKSSEHDMEKDNSIPKSGVPATAMETKYKRRSSNDILEDCQ